MKIINPLLSFIYEAKQNCQLIDLPPLKSIQKLLLPASGLLAGFSLGSQNFSRFNPQTSLKPDI